ncbi:MAG TPA: cell division protein SepF [Candidatus Gallacutalibacter pullistercoris]|nr:cell division protein SepF [Candidatus Gallacutalibacter pullistercoris]
MAGFVDKIQKMWNPPDDEVDYVYDEEMEMQEEADAAEAVQEEAPARRSSSAQGSNKVVNIHATAQLQVVLFKPENFGEETRAVADELLKMHTVVLNLEETKKETARRIIDFLSGVAYANGGKIKRVATSTYIITPYNVDLTGDEVMDELENNGVYV